MKISIVSFTGNGIQLSKKIASELVGVEYTLFTKCTSYLKEEPAQYISFVDKNIGEWAKEQMQEKNALLFIGACGIAVRAVAPYIKDKLHDSPVLVIDEMGRYVIPILSGHMGGANELALSIAEKIGAEAVITTATDVNRKFAVDIFAKKNGLFIVNKDGIAKVSSKILAGADITISIEPRHVGENFRVPEGVYIVSYPPAKPVDIVVTSTEGEYDAAILLKPKEYVIGMGCRKGKEADKIEALIIRSMQELGISPAQILALSSVEQKRNEQGFLVWSRKANVPFVTYTTEELQRVKGDFHKSGFVKDTVGIDNVCERAALKACEPGGKLVYEKHAEDGMTIAVAKREWRVVFNEI